ncbi:MAG TPA: hypothetical protein VJ551_01495 [Nitrososphaeraceae archaeon]|nr:hypothetical protein [Nitrososphaeraceae archaeon]
MEGESNSRSTAVGNTTTIAIESDDETITQNRTQINAIIVQQKEMDRVGFEPTTSAAQPFFKAVLVTSYPMVVKIIS